MKSNCEERPSVQQLLSMKRGSDIGYGELLLTKEWCIKRNEIIKRDGRRCQKCQKEETIFLERGLHAKLKWSNEWDPIQGLIPEPILEKADEQIVLHVHHTLYILDKLPWEYKDDDLITLCHSCHDELHRSGKAVPVYSTTGDLLAQISPCVRCNGSGYLNQYSHVQGGICFNCRGRRYNRDIITSFRKE